MDHHRKLSLVVLGSLFSSLLLLYECRELKGYKFPVYTTKSCPRNKIEWEERSSEFNCQGESSYACFPNEDITELLEFCYPLEVISIHKDVCLFLVKDSSKIDSYDCKHFVQGCPTGFYRGSTVYTNPSCILIGNGCFLAEPNCPSVTEDSFIGTSSVNTTSVHNKGSYWISIVTLSGTFLLLCFPCMLLVLFLRRRKNRKYLLDEDPDSELETKEFIKDDESALHEETEFEKSVFRQWQKDDDFFYSTKATSKVEKLIKINNLVMVTGHSGSGKSAIIQHIALKYRKEGWIVKPVYSVEEIHDAYKSMTLENTKCFFVFNDPFGKECFDEILYNEWGRYRDTLNILFKNGKLLMTCRKSIFVDQRAKGFFEGKPKQIDINDSHCILTTKEKKKIFQKHLPEKQLTKEDFDKICEIDMYFPLLCNLYKGKLERNEDVLRFFEELLKVLKDEIESYKNRDKEKYCALVCLILSNNKLCTNEFMGNNALFLQSLKLCDLPAYTSTYAIKNKLDSLEGFLVKKIDQTYTFYHDFVMEVTNYVFGSEHPEETVKFADVSFLRNRIRMENSKSNDFLTIVLNKDNIVHLVDRLFKELFGNRFIEVVLNPCLRNKHVIRDLETKLESPAHKKELALIIKPQKKTLKQDFKVLMNKSSCSRLKFVSSQTESSPLFALIAFCHDDLSKLCLRLLRKENIDLKRSGVFSAICSNGNEALIKMFTEDEICEYMEVLWENMYPIHIMSLFHNYNLLHYVIKAPEDANRRSSDEWMATPLELALSTDTQELEKSGREDSTESDRRDKTVKKLIQNGAEVNSCGEHSPLLIACLNGYDSTAEILLANGAEVNVCNSHKLTPLIAACYCGLKKAVQVLLQKGADVNVSDNKGATPLFAACKNRCESIVQLLLQHGAEVNRCDKRGTSPILAACRNGYEKNVRLLLQYRAEVNKPDNNDITPLLEARKHGHESIVQLLLQNGAM